MDGNASSFFTGAATNVSFSQQQRRAHAIRPVTIKQLLQSQRVGEGVTVIDGSEVTQASVVGRVVGYEDDGSNRFSGGALTAKHYGYKISDGTGVMVVRQWMEAQQQDDPLPLHCYVRVSGSMKIWQGVPVVTGSVRLVSDCNELNYHFLDVILTHLRLTRGPCRPPGADAPAAVPNTPSAVGVQNVLPGGDGKLFATDVVVNVLKQKTQGDGGLSMDEISAAVRQYGFGVQDVRNAIRTLMEEGKVYQTHDSKFSV